jgi:hypothetical protein
MEITILSRRVEQGCQMVYFQTKNPNLGEFFRTLDGEMLIYLNFYLECFTDICIFMIIWYILCSFGTFFQFWYHARRKIWQPWIGRVPPTVEERIIRLIE